MGEVKDERKRPLCLYLQIYVWFICLVLFQPLQNVLFLVSVALMPMSSQSEPQHAGEVVVAVCGLPRGIL